MSLAIPACSAIANRRLPRAARRPPRPDAWLRRGRVGGAARAHVTPATLSDVVAPSASRDTRRAKSELRLRRLSWQTSSPALLPGSATGPGYDTDQGREEHGDD